MISQLINLYLTFLKIGSFAFGGGYAVLPLIQRYVVTEQKWLTIKDLTNLVSLSQITPGPIGINSATFIGTKVAGLTGAIIATIAEVTPCCILMLILAHFVFRGKKISFIDKILLGLKPVIPALILIAAIDMFKSSLFLGSDIKIIGLIGFIVGGILFISKKISIIKIIMITAFLGFVLNFII